MFAPRTAKPKTVSVSPIVRNRATPSATVLRSKIAAHEPGSEIAPAIQSAIARKRGGGEALTPEDRRSMETAFAADFGSVRVHADTEAGQMSRAIGANAFATGKDIFFGQGKYRPESASGRKLLAHELAHVVQQREAVPSRLVLGEPGDSCEREADAIANEIGSQHGSDAGFPPANIARATPASANVLRRDTPKEKDKKKDSKSAETKTTSAPTVHTWAGDFTATTFDLVIAGDDYGADMVISFMPNKSANAESIALVQTNQSVKSTLSGNVDQRDDVPQPNTVKTPKAQEVFKSRLVESVTGFGTHIDANPQSRTPLMNTTAESKDTDLAQSKPIPDFKSEGVNIHTQFGFRTDKRGAQAAKMADTPRQTLAVDASGSQSFETAALAIDGVQKGAYYGSVKWGWKKEKGKTSPDPILFEKATDAAPSPTFSAAANAFNASTNTKDEASLALPISGNKVLSDASELKDSPDKKGKTSAKLAKGAAVGTFEDKSHPGWTKVIVTGSSNAGKIGWVDTSKLTDPPSDSIIPKKKK